jgi:hypothetical protein
MLILYPTLAIALAGAIPTVMQQVKAWRSDTTVAKLALVEEQDRLWRRNLECIQQASAWEVDGPAHLVIKLTVCEGSGDILARYFQNDWAPTYRWLSRPEGKDRQRTED